MGGVQKIVLDAGPLISQTREEILAKGEHLFATLAVIREIKDEDARRRLELLKDDITVKQPSAAAVKHVIEFAKLTGDSLVLSTQDIEVIALAYDIAEDKSQFRSRPVVSRGDTTKNIVVDNEDQNEEEEKEEESKEPEQDDDGFTVVKSKAPKPRKQNKPAKKEEPPAPAIESLNIDDSKATGDNDDDSDWSDDDWISPDNIEEKVQSDSTTAGKMEETVEVAVASRDYAVQNTALQMGICAVNEKGLRIKQLKSFMQRCYACFKLVPMNPQGAPRQFCPQCGGHTLTRVSTSVDKYGKLHVHLKSKMQWITRGDRYNLPNPQSQRARRQQHDRKIEFYTEDQPEYLKAMKKQYIQQRHNERMVNNYIGPNTVDSAMSPFAPNRAPSVKVPIGRGRYANATGKKTETK